MTKNKIDISVNPKEFIWAQKYRPQTVNDMILPKKIKRRLLNSVKGKTIPHYLFTSIAGTGKCLYKDEKLNLMVTDEVYNKMKEMGII